VVGAVVGIGAAFAAGYLVSKRKRGAQGDKGQGVVVQMNDEKARRDVDEYQQQRHEIDGRGRVGAGRWERQELP
jgi:hypothetical protein